MKTSEVKKLLQELDIKPLKSLGQNFLINSEIINKIVCAYDLKNYEALYEIGPGLGSLTRALNSKDFKLIELDKTLAQYWKEQGYEVFHGDALKFPWKEVHKKSLLISNLPYKISSRILIEIFVTNPNIQNMVLMFQKEVGDRLKAGPEDKKTYGLISIVGQLNWSIKRLTLVSKTNFYPSPDIESEVLCFEKKEDLKALDRKAFVRHLKLLFAARRKKIKSSLKKKKFEEGFSTEVLEKRPDQLTAEEHLSLFKAIADPETQNL